MKSEIKQRINQLNNGDIPDGYKKTDFGVFPCDWVTDKCLKKICEINPKTEELPERFIYVDLESVLDRRIVEKNVIEKDNAPSRAQRVLSLNDIAFQVVRPYQKNNLFFQTEDETFKTVVSTGYALLRSKTQRFLFQLLHSDYFVNQVNVKCTGTNYPAINGDDLGKVMVAFPPLATEQEKIAEILMKWDKAIELQEKMIIVLEQKQNLSLKSVLDVRSGQWDSRPLSYYMFSRNDTQTPSSNAPLMAFVAYEGIIEKGERYDRSQLIKNDNKKYKVTYLNDFIYSSNNLDVGSIGLNKYGTAVISVVYEVFAIKDTAVPCIIDKIIRLPKNIAKIISYRQGAFYGQYKIHPDDFLKVEVKAPPLDVQIQLANYISSIEAYINQQKRKLELLKCQRKVLQQYLLNGIVRVN